MMKLSATRRKKVNDIEERNNYPEYVEKEFRFKVAKGQSPERIDTYLTKYIYNATRNRVQQAIDDGNVTINGYVVKSSRKVQPNDEILCKIMKAPPIELLPENIPLDIKFEDDYLLVVNKPAGMVTHPGFGHRYGTLVNAVLYHFGLRQPIEIETAEDDDDEADLEEFEDKISEPTEGEIYASESIRPGIVHRLDKDTSGLLVIAKNPAVHANLAAQFAARTTEREYNAIVWGKINEDEGSIEGDIGRSTRNRKNFAVVKKGGKYAKTDFKVIDRFRFATLVKLKLHTGRTHQIRVHLNHINNTVFGDPAYGGDKNLYGGTPEINKIANKCLKMVNRQLLHARTLGFTHPVTKEFMSFDCELPADFVQVIEFIKYNLPE
ncbi:MAG: RluA family pseudouridine synthase [Candidatus Kapabacteria bacterium]|nr:RluA family pseudouridine synthase [Ignavibacteriota bacterium]MCW5885974.1 RluA family pseudouridine synthase [Candidatus Kapabacteria bacterium]